ncbi:MAG: hypothetical protein EAZ95_00675 [Bacteroidetes bacterium]|nr:MAG: hypothetical protein EAZ95_00675 [Bacteroidota bacterium]
MYIKSLRIQNFKSFEDVCFEFNPDVNIFTGENNAGKTTLLEAIALWQECFVKLLIQAKRDNKRATAYKKGDYVLGNNEHKYFPFEQINSIRSPNFEDIFFQRITGDKVKIQLVAQLQHEDNELEVGFQIGSSGSNYLIENINKGQHNNYYKDFNDFFDAFPYPINIFYASPVSSILQVEDFTTPPIIRKAILERNSATVLRNRLYAIYNNTHDVLLFDSFLKDLNYILSNGIESKKIIFIKKTDIQRDAQVIFNFKVGEKDVEKDIALLGSGTLQIIEILLNLYYKEQKSNLNLILLDEPDSHIHRDIQARLLEVIGQKSKESQFFVTTHNEAFIRNAVKSHLFHLENTPKNSYKPLNVLELAPIQKTGDKRFKGIYPSHTDSIMRSIGEATGLDFINAIEADKIIFVEGEEDAQYLYLLLHKATPKQTNKYVFWVLNGISHVFKDILGYKTLFEQIKNKKTLWEKSALVMDRDFLSDEHYPEIVQKMKDKLKLPTHIANAYTFEGILLTDIEKLAELLERWLIRKQIHINTNLVETLLSAYENLERILQTKYLANTWVEGAVLRYIDVREKTKTLFLASPITENNNVKLTLYYQEQVKKYIQSKTFYKLAKKEDVAWVINQVLQPYDLTFDIEHDFIDLLKLVDVGTWFEEWNFIKDLAK